MTDIPETLLSCPFCGGEAIMLKDHAKLGVYITCQSCFVASVTGTQTEVTAAWNRRAAQAERMARMEEALTKRIEWHTCSCPEPCDDYWVFPGGCIGKYREDYHSLRALSQEGSEPS